MSQAVRKSDASASSAEKPGHAIARVIRSRREELRLGQGELAHLVGAHPQTLNKIERGEIEFSRFFGKIEIALQLAEGTLLRAAAEKHDQGHGHFIGTKTGQHRGPVTLPELKRYRGVVTHEKLDAPLSQLKNGFAADLPLHSSSVVNFDEHVMSVSAQAVSLTARPEPLATVRDAYAVLVSTFSMVPAYEAGDIIWLNPHLPVIDHKDVLLRRANDGGTGAGDAILCRLETITATHWVVREHAGGHKRTSRKILRKTYPLCHRVVGKLCRN